jgi:hypothetical protein
MPRLPTKHSKGVAAESGWRNKLVFHAAAQRRDEALNSRCAAAPPREILFVSQRHQRVDSGCAARRNVAGQQRDHQ